MKHCTQCGHVLGLGRFCTNCGHPVAARLTDPLTDPLEPEDAAPRDEPAEPEAPAEPAPVRAGRDWRADTAERAPRPTAPPAPRAVSALAPRTPPVAAEAPPPPRFPLFADEVVEAPAPPTTATASEALDSWAPAADGADGVDLDWAEDDWEDDWEERRRPRLLWVLGGLVVLAALVTAAWFLGNALGGDDDATDDPPAAGGTGAGEQPVDRTAEASAKAPRTAPPNQDVDGNPTSYDASNMLDGVPETAWRAAGDGRGIKIVFTFPEKTRIAEVGLVNGYVKEASDASGGTFDWYAGHRRIEQVTWNFGVGDVVRQDLVEDREVQSIEVKPVEVRKVVLKIIATTAPGEGPSRRDFTAISDVLLVG